MSIDAIVQERLRNVFAVVSEVRSSTGVRQYRRKVHLTLGAAQRAAERAQERGLEARIILCQIHPLEDGEAL